MSESPVVEMVESDSEDAASLCARRRVLDSARAEIRDHGILGLRVARVAANANYTVSVIYRHFIDRQGLLAAVLAELYAEILNHRSERIAERLPPSGPLSIDDIVRLAPAPSELVDSEELRLQLQILAVAATNPALEERLREIAQETFRSRVDLLRQLSARLPEGQTFDERVYTVIMVNHMLYYNTLLGEHAVTDDQYFDFLAQIAGGCRPYDSDPDPSRDN